MRFTPDLPASTARQKASLPRPFGLTTPMPVMTTRGSIERSEFTIQPSTCCRYPNLPFQPESKCQLCPECWLLLRDNHTDAARIVHRHSILSNQVHLLQFRFGRIFSCGVRQLRQTALCRDRAFYPNCTTDGSPNRSLSWVYLLGWRHAHSSRSSTARTGLCHDSANFCRAAGC